MQLVLAELVNALLEGRPAQNGARRAHVLFQPMQRRVQLALLGTKLAGPLLAVSIEALQPAVLPGTLKALEPPATAADDAIHLALI